MSDEFISTLTLLKLPAMKNYYTRALLLEKYMTRNNCFYLTFALIENFDNISSTLSDASMVPHTTVTYAFKTSGTAIFH